MHDIPPDDAQAAQFLIKGLQIEESKKPAPTSTTKTSNSTSSAGPSGSTSQSGANGKPTLSSSQSPHIDGHAKTEQLNLEVTAHLSETLTGLYRKGRLTPDTGHRKGKGKEVCLWQQGAQVAYRLLGHPSIVRPNLVSSVSRAGDEVWAPSTLAPPQRPSSQTRRSESSSHSRQPHLPLTSNQQLRRSTYVALCYLLALVAYDSAVRKKSMDQSEAMQWWGRCIAIEKEAGGPGTREASQLVGKAHARVEMLLAARRREEGYPKLQGLSFSPPARSSSSQAIFKHARDKSLSPTAVLDSPTLDEPPRKPLGGWPQLSRRHSEMPKAASASSSNGKPSDREPPAVPFPQASASSPSRTRRRSLATSELFAPTTNRARSQTSTLPARPKSALRLLSTHTARSSASRATCYVSEEVIGVPQSGLRHRASSVSLLSDAQLGSGLRSRALSSASIASLPHTLSGFEYSHHHHNNNNNKHRRTDSLSSSVSRQHPLAHTATAQEGDESSDSSDLVAGGGSEAAEVLSTLLRNDLIAEQDFYDWTLEEEVEEEEEGEGEENNENEDEGHNAEFETATGARRSRQRGGPQQDNRSQTRHSQANGGGSGAASASISASDEGLTTPHDHLDSPRVRVQSPSTEGTPRSALATAAAAAPTNAPAAATSSLLSIQPKPPGRRRTSGSRHQLDPVLAAVETASKFSKKSECSVCRVKGVNLRELPVE